MVRVSTTKIIIALLFFSGVLSILMAQPQPVAAACAALPTDRGSVGSTLAAPVAGTYRVWSRIKTADATKNAFYLQIDDTTCNVTVAVPNIQADTWTWVDYQAGTATNKLNVSLTAGNHSLIMAGKDDNLELDRVILTQDPSCVPVGTGDNCAYPPDTTPPTVSITAPANNITATTLTNVDVAASDDKAVTKVEFYVNNVLRATDSSAPYSYGFDPATLTPGVYTIAAKAFDAAGNSTTSGLLTITVPDTTKPLVSLTSPAANATVSGTIAVLATATDNVAVTKVEFYVDNVLKATDTSSTYSASIDTKIIADGSHTVIAKAYDAANNSQASTAVTVTIDNVPNQSPDTTPPVITLTSPQTGSTVNGTIVLTATASDASGLNKVDFYNGSTLLGSDSTAPFSYSLDTTKLVNGSLSLKAIATDNAPNANTATSAAVIVTISNPAYRPEDIDQNGSVSLRDFSLLAADYGHSGSAITVLRTDIDQNGIVDLHDFSLLAAKYGQ